MSAEPIEPSPEVVRDLIAGPGGTWWLVAQRDAAGHPIELRQMHDVAAVRGQHGEVIGFSVGVHPSRGLLHPEDVIFKPEPARGHACAMLAEMDCYAAAGDQRAARLARWHEKHPDGPTTPAEAVEEAAIRAGFAKRRLP